MEVKSEILDRALMEFPGMEQSNPVEDADFFRFTARLRVDSLNNHRQPEIFMIFTHNEFEQAKGIDDGLKQAFRRKLRHHCFKDSINGKTVKTSVQEDRSGVWHAVTVDGAKWIFDRNRNLWVRDSIRFTA